MKTIYVLLLAALVAVATTLVLTPRLAHGTEPDVIRETVEVSQPTLSPAQIIWLARLMQCESGLKANAVNPKDLDNTPSYGLLQFKPSTFKAAAIKYNLASTTDYMNPELQVEIVQNWILDGSVKWAIQFPACVKKFGVPPANKV